METREILKQLREKNSLTQEQMAEQVMVPKLQRKYVFETLDLAFPPCCAVCVGIIGCPPSSPSFSL